MISLARALTSTPTRLSYFRLRRRPVVQGVARHAASASGTEIRSLLDKAVALIRVKRTRGVLNRCHLRTPYLLAGFDMKGLAIACSRVQLRTIF